MCGRFALYDWQEGAPAKFHPRYNIAPRSLVWVMTLKEQAKTPVFGEVFWGLNPLFDAEAKMFFANARKETVRTKPSFAKPFQTSRCVFLVNHWYEWQGKQPHLIRPRNNALSYLAGIYQDKKIGDTWIRTAAILTQDANPQLALIHDRMPCVFDRSNYALWFEKPDQALENSAAGYEQDFLTHPVAKDLNSGRNEGAELMQSIDLLL